MKNERLLFGVLFLVPFFLLALPAGAAGNFVAKFFPELLKRAYSQAHLTRLGL